MKTNHPWRGFVISVLLALALTIVPLPAWADAFRPAWVALVVVYWSLVRPDAIGIGFAWVAGLLLDVMTGDLLGQNAFALAVIAYLVVRFHLRLRVFPIAQQAVTVLLLIGLYEFLLFWIDGVTREAAPGMRYWGPILLTLAAWPLTRAVLSQGASPAR